MSNPAYKRVFLRATGAPEADTGVVLLALDVAGRNWADALRLSLSLEEAEAIAMALIGDAAIQRHRQAIQRHRLICDQSDMSSEIPSSDGSPQEGQSVAPLARSSTACCGER
jgi:hypothetical protein